MIELKELTGDIYVEEINEDNSMVKNTNNLYRYMIFESNKLSIYLCNNFYLPIKEEHFEKNGENMYYYPTFNETRAILHLNELDKNNLKKYKENVTIKYLVLNNTIYINSQSDLTAYGGLHIYFENNIYRIHDPLLVNCEKDFNSDPLLDIESKNNSILVENLYTGVKYPVEKNIINELIKNNDNNGFIEVEKPDNIIRSIIDKLNN